MFTLITCLAFSTLSLAQEGVEVEVLPRAPVVERHRAHYSLQCDFRITNGSAGALSLYELEVRELDAENALIRSRSVNGNGTAPSIRTVIDGAIPAGSVRHVFNPFYRFDPDALPARFEFLFTFGLGTTRWTKRVAFDARVYATRADLRLPMDGRLLLWDGHDFLSHHRRLGLDHPAVRTMGLRSNSSRFAGDFVVLGPNGAQTRRAPSVPADWFGWDAPVLAPGHGRVVGLRNDFPDNTVSAGRVLQDRAVTPLNPESLAGNYVALDHGDGEFSVLGHLREGSVVVEVGQEVEGGELIGKVGLSGSTTHVHLHYQLQTSSDLFGGEGLPAAFRRFRLHRGSETLLLEDAPVDTGDVVEHAEREGFKGRTRR